MPAFKQPPKPSTTLNPSYSLKTWQWITPLVILAALVGGYFAYQNYLLKKTAREISSFTPSINQITKEQALKLIAQNYPQIIASRGNVANDDSITETSDGWLVYSYWGRCPDCYCLFDVKNDGSIEVKEKGEEPSLCERTEAPESIKEDVSDLSKLSVIGVYSYEITSMCVQSCDNAGIHPFYQLTEPLPGIESAFDDVVVFVEGGLVEVDKLPTIAGPNADMSNFGVPLKTTLLKVENYKKIDFPKISLSQAELKRYLKNEDSIFELEFENPTPKELTVVVALYDLGVTPVYFQSVTLEPLGITKALYTYKEYKEGNGYKRTPEDNFEITVTGGDKIDMEKLVVNGELRIPDKGRIIYVNQMVDLEDVIEN